MSQDASPRRFVIWAVALVLPVVVAAAVIPWLRQRPGPGPAAGAAARPPEARAAEAVRAAEAAAAGRTSQADAALDERGAPGHPRPLPGAEAPPRAEGPTTAQIEAARAAQEALIEAQKGWRTVETMAPREARPDASGDLVAPFEGFGLSVESTPPGATVLVGGRDVGETPLVTTVDCRPGAEVDLRVARKGWRSQARLVRCREDALVTVRFALVK